MNIGDIITINPTRILARDGNVYDVFSLHETGYDWSSRSYYTTGVNVPAKSLKAQIVPRQTQLGKSVFVKLIEDTDQPLFPFKKHPYVRKDGSFTVVDTETFSNGFERIGIASQYGATVLEEYMWLDQDGKGNYVQHFYKDLLDGGWLKQNERAVLTHIYLK